MATTFVKVNVLEASGLAGEPGNTNPYVVIAAGKSRFKTQIQEGTVDPIWEEPFTVNLEDSKKILVTVWNKGLDANVSDEFLGLVTLDQTNMIVDGSKNWYQLNPRRGKDDLVTGEICLSFVQSKAVVEKVSKDDIKKMEVAVKEKVTEAVNQNSFELDLSGLNLSIVPVTIKSFHLNWTNIDLGFNKFTNWPTLNDFAMLEELWLTGNQLMEMGKDLTGLRSLKSLYINGNALTAIPDSICHLSALEKLDAANNQIRTISPRIGELRKLEELNLSGNPLGTVPSSMSKLELLEVLDLSGCELQILPSEFPGMIRLLELNLGNNQLKKLPEEFGKMSRLVSLNLSDNMLSELPVTMGSCVHMDSCLLERNPLKDQEMMRKYNLGTDHLVDYLSKRMFAIKQEEKLKERQKARGEKAEADKARREQAAKVQSFIHSLTIHSLIHPSSNLSPW
eukprot:TRINITY_DN4479_c2_g1_i1.p1 TRINITY_DN4479_c2_g1~~TRINITY_DN4479_c2_g1_i1.p1  ORF type:complete len:451 (-),score=104.43 TRINITY_DN4479_c2_g1_i1:62-1414(-)